MFKEGMLALVGQGFIETIYMTVISTALAYIIGLPLGLVLVVTDKDGIHPIPWLNSLLGMIINFFRSIPFLILLIALMPSQKGGRHSNRLQGGDCRSLDCSRTLHRKNGRILFEGSGNRRC